MYQQTHEPDPAGQSVQTAAVSLPAAQEIFPTRKKPGSQLGRQNEPWLNGSATVCVVRLQLPPLAYLLRSMELLTRAVQTSRTRVLTFSQSIASRYWAHRNIETWNIDRWYSGIVGAAQGTLRSISWIAYDPLYAATTARMDVLLSRSRIPDAPTWGENDGACDPWSPCDTVHWFSSRLKLQRVERAPTPRTHRPRLLHCRAPPAAWDQRRLSVVRNRL
jgi:hypothetical protein